MSTAVAEPAERASYGELFRVREFTAIFVAWVASMLGNIVAAVALTVLVYERTHSTAFAASTMSLAFVPYLLGGTFLSAAAQRWRPRRTLVCCDLLSAAIVGVMAAVRLPIGVLLGLLFVEGLVAPVFAGVRSATLPAILAPGGQYLLGRSVLRIVAQVAQVAGYALGGVLLIALSPRDALAIDAASFAVSAIVLRVWTTERRPAVDAHDAGSRQSMAGASLAGVRDVLAVRAVRRVLLLSWLLPACLIAPEALAAPYVVHIGAASNATGYFLTACPVGAVIADVVVARALGRRGRRNVVTPATLLGGLVLLGFLIAPKLPLALALMFVMGVGYGYGPGLDQELVDVSPEPLLPVALSISSSGLMFTQGVGAAVWGVVAEVVSLPVVIGVAGACAVVVAVGLRTLRIEERAPAGNTDHALRPAQ